jgi:DNA-binding NarL/FixJ family response regulator
MAVIAGPSSPDRPRWIEDSKAQSGLGSHAAIPTNIRLIITSSVRLVREGLAATLRGRDGVVVVEAVDPGPGGIARIADAEPDVVLVDLGETDTNTFTAARLIKAGSPHAKLVAFGLDEIDERVFACAAAGFSGYVPRDSGADELHRALVDAMEGRMHCAPHIAAAMFNRLAGFLREPDPRRRCRPSRRARAKSWLSYSKVAQTRTSRVSLRSVPPRSRTTCITSYRSCR